MSNQIREWSKEKNYNNKAFTIKPTTDFCVHHLKCVCLMCNPYQHKIEKKLLQNQELQLQENKQSRMMSKFPQSHLEKVLRGLMIPNNKIVKRGVQVYIPQVCFFEDGEVSNFYYNKDLDDYQLMRLRKDKVTQTLMAKLFNERRRHYREKIKKHLMMEPSKKEQSMYKRKKQKNDKNSKYQHISVAIIRYTDGCQTLISQNELLLILQKRKTDPFWKKVSYIRNYIPQVNYSQGESLQIEVKFDSQTPLYPELWRRANQLMQTYNGHQLPTSPEFISNAQQSEFCQKLRAQSHKILATYVFYKIVSFIACFADQKILKAVARLLVNQVGQCYLLQVRKLTMISLIKYSFTNEIYQKMIQQQQENKYHKKELQINPQIVAKSEVINDLMSGEYQNLKKRYGITVEPKEDINQKLNNQFFAFLYPSLEADISDLIQLDIPLTTFRRKFLGQKKERKPLFKGFNSKLVRQLHQLTPVPKHYRTLSLKQQQGSTSRATSWKQRNTSSFSRTMPV